MRRKKKITIVTFESRERMTIRVDAPSVIGWCERGCGEVLMVTANEAARIAGMDARAVFRGIETGQIHFIETERGGIFICTKSLEQECGGAPRDASTRLSSLWEEEK